MLSFLGLCNYYRKLIPHFSEWAAPLYSVSRETKIFSTAQLEKPFKKLKEAACEVRSIKIPDPTKPLYLKQMPAE